MSYSRRILRLAWFFGVLLVLLAGTTAYRMLVQGDDLARRAYEDRPMAGLLDDLARKGVIRPSGDGVEVDRERLKEEVPRPGLRQWVLDRRPYLSFEDGGLRIDPAAVTVSNRRLLRASVGADRGRILDRTGQVLARNVTREGDGRVLREYPLGPAGLPLLGVAHPVYGLKGLERSLAPYLEGEAEERWWQRIYRFLSGRKRTCDVVLTLDAAIQEKAFAALEGLTGAVVVLDARTGGVLAAASRPSFDPAAPAGPAWDAAARLRYKGPFVNRGLERRYPPGSTFKLVTAAAWMEQEGFDPDWGLPCRGRHPKYRIREYRGRAHGWVSLRTAVRLSCNVFFADVGPRLGPALADAAERFGFNRDWLLLGHETRAIVPSRAFRGHPGVREGRDWEPVDFERNPKLVAQGAVGQNVVAATPLQMAMVGAALANEGVLMAPRLVKSVGYAPAEGQGEPGWIDLRSEAPREAGRACSEDTAEAILGMMASVMDTGTGYALQKLVRDGKAFRAVPVLPEGAENVLAGKTGTAQSRPDRGDHAWFVAVAPLDEPRFAVAVMAEHAGLGGKEAGPVAVEVMLETLNRAAGFD